MILVVGLGNPGPKYAKNRHNIGFWLIDLLVENFHGNDISNKKFKGKLFKAKDLLFLKPETFMNLSGESVDAVCRFYDVDDVIVIHDDLDLNLGALKYKRGGSSGGHNGLKSIDEYIGDDYIRVRFGIGKPTRKSEVISYVLSDFTHEEVDFLEESIKTALEAIEQLPQIGLNGVKQKYSLKKNLI